MSKKSKKKNFFNIIPKKKDKVEVVAHIQKMDCKQAKDDKTTLICDIVATGGDEQIKEKIAIAVPKLKFVKVSEEGEKPKYYYKEIVTE